MRVNTRLSRNTSLSMSPAGWLIVGPILAIPLAAVLAVALAVAVAALVAGGLVWLIVKTILLTRTWRYRPAHK